MDKIKIESYPAIESLNKFANELPPEYRAKLYKTAEAFISIGAMNGIFEMGHVKSDQDDWVKYLSKMAHEAEAVTQTTEGITDNIAIKRSWIFESWSVATSKNSIWGNSCKIFSS